MRALEFESTITPNGQIAPPPEVASEIPMANPFVSS
jgi:hypothetical protein